MMGSIAIDAWVSQYASACSRGVSLLKLSASSCMKPVEPTRSTSVLLFSAPALADVPGVPLFPLLTENRQPLVSQLTRSTAAAAQLAPNPTRSDFNLPSCSLNRPPPYVRDWQMPYRLPGARGQYRFLHETRQIFGSIHVIPQITALYVEAGGPCSAFRLFQHVRRRPLYPGEHLRMHAPAGNRVIAAIFTRPELHVSRRIQQPLDMPARQSRRIAAQNHRLRPTRFYRRRDRVK